MRETTPDKIAATENSRRDCWPTREQLLLLKASLLEGDQALAAWESWHSLVDLDTIDYASHRMLPLLYRNLVALGVQHDWMARMKGVYRRTWYENQLLFHNMSGVLKALHDAQIETMILKGTALILLCYKDYGLRGMGDYDILVRTEDAERAIDVVRGLGWKPVWLDLQRKGLSEVRHSCDFHDDADHLFDLHWHALHECCTPDADAEFWNGSIPVSVHGVRTRAMNATDQLLHVCVHGARWDPTPPFRWIADSIVLLNNKAMPMDWNRLLRQAKERELTLPMRDTLTYLSENFGANVPPHVLSTLARSRTTIVERIEYNVRIQPLDQTGPLSAFISNYAHFARLRNKQTALQKLGGLPRFLQQYWGIRALWHVPFAVVFRTVRRTWKLLRSTVADYSLRLLRTQSNLLV